MIDFPASPSTGQIFTAAGASWRYDGTKWVAYGSGSGNAGRNLIHNPLMAVAQRGVGPFAAAGYTLDRWTIGRTADTVSVQQTSHTDTTRGQIGDEAATYAMQNVFTGNAAAFSFNFIHQPVESVRRLSGKTVTISFWAACVSGTPKLGVSVDQYFGSGGSPSATVNGTGQSVTLNTTWARYTMTFAVPSISGKTVGTNRDDYTQVIFWYSAEASWNARSGSIGVQSGTIGLWGVQLEIGSAATPLEKPDIQQDIAKCFRFYQIVTASVRATGAGIISLSGGVGWQIMRATPTATLNTAGLRSNVTSVVLVPMSVYGGRFDAGSVAAGDAYALGDIWNLSADL